MLNITASATDFSYLGFFQNTIQRDILVYMLLLNCIELCCMPPYAAPHHPLAFSLAHYLLYRQLQVC